MNRDVKADFPLLERKLDGAEVIYLDSAATSLKPRSVIAAEQAYSTEFTSNVHRGHSALSGEASYHYEAARRKIARFIGAEPASVVLTPNTSCALGLVAGGIGLEKSDVVLCSQGSHHANLLPWLQRATVEYIDGDPLGAVDPDEVIKAIRKFRPKILAVGWTSNVNGVVSPISEICRAAREHGVITVVDAAQAVPHIPVDVRELNCDFLAFSGHKMLGPTGTGVLWGRRELLEMLHPLFVAGGTVARVSPHSFTLKDLPQRLEPGTPNISGVIGLGAAVEYLENLGATRMLEHERAMVTAMHRAFGSLPGARVLCGSPGCEQVAIASIVPIGNHVHSDTVCQILSDTYKIMTRSGFHCAHPLFDGCEFTQGAVRLSAYIYTSVEDVIRAGQALEQILGRIAGTRH